MLGLNCSSDLGTHRTHTEPTRPENWVAGTIGAEHLPHLNPTRKCMGQFPQTAREPFQWLLHLEGKPHTVIESGKVVNLQGVK